MGFDRGPVVRRRLASDSSGVCLLVEINETSSIKSSPPVTKPLCSPRGRITPYDEEILVEREYVCALIRPRRRTTSSCNLILARGEGEFVPDLTGWKERIFPCTVSNNPDSLGAKATE